MLPKSATKYDEFFEKATIDKLLTLTWQEFQLFIDHVFTYAGYSVKDVSGSKWPSGPGFDLELYEPSNTKLASYVEVRRLKEDNLLDFNDVAAFIGTLTLAQQEVPSFMVTTSSFTGPARAAATKHGNIFLVDGAHLLRYIKYIGNSRVKNQNAQAASPVFISPKVLWDADNIVLQDPRKTTIVTVGNNKGGVAKTTTTINLGFALAKQNQRVLLVDVDSQASLTATLPPPDEDIYYLSMLDFFMNTTSLASIIRPTKFPNVWLLPAHLDLKHLDTGASALPTDELHLARTLNAPDLLAPDNKPFDWIIIDTPPAQTRYTRAALASSHYVLIPTVVETYASLGLNQMIATSKAMQALMGKNVDILGVFVTRWIESRSTKDHLKTIEDGVRLNGVRFLETKIPNDGKIEKAHTDTAKGKLQNLFGLTSPAASGYTKLMEEITDNDKHVTAFPKK